MSENIPDTGKEVVDTTRYKMVASLSIAGHSVNAISKQLKMTNYMVKKIRASDEFKNYLEELKEKAVTEAINLWKTALAEATPDVLNLFRELVKDKNPKALDVYLKTIGIDKETVQQQASNLTVVLPDFDQAKTIEVISEK